ncbi:MAG: SMP-30/gluconolactonase/LRE family protein [Ginsengibacter sp.]
MKVISLIIFVFITNLCLSQTIGIFDNQADIGNNITKGNADYLSSNQQYIISGSGYNVWGDHDEFHYVYKKMKGDFILYSRASLAGWEGIDPHRKLGWMIRKSLDSKSAHINACVHGDGLTSLQFRKQFGGQTEEIKSELKNANVIQLERKGNIYTMRVARFGQPFIEQHFDQIDLGDEVYVGLFVSSHNADVIETGIFSDVRISVSLPGIADKSTQMTLGSNLEVCNVISGERKIIYSVPYSIQAPNWMNDGENMIFNDSKGVMYKFNLKEKRAVELNTGSVKRNNNDHVLSFDNSKIGLSSWVKELGGSIIYTVSSQGGTPKQVTPKGPSYLHGWSPDGKYLVFCGERNGNFDVYKIPSDGGTEQRLTDTPGLDDGPEYTPDGKYIYFNSVRSGMMQIWRMHPDGTNQEQITNDDFNNWFAHISPDGKSMVFLSFLKEEVQPGDHPPYKHVYIRYMPISGGTPKVIAYVYGGQGSINTPSWSPDSKKIAFISNSKMTQ